MHIIVVGAGLGGLSAAIAILQAGHKVTILEGAHEINEVGAGIQTLPNATKILFDFGLKDQLLKRATRPQFVYMNRWKGDNLTKMDFHKQGERFGYPFLDFHRADLQAVMLERTKELGAEIVVDARVEQLSYDLVKKTVTCSTKNGDKFTADLVVGADGINSKLRELLVGHSDPPSPTGDLAYRLLIPTEKMLDDPELREFVERPQVNYWIGPKAHCVNYILKNGKLFNFVLLCPDTVPDNMTICSGQVDEMKEFFKDWDPRITKLINLVPTDTVDKWKLCYRLGIDNWSHPSNMVTLLGDSVHATLPYLASGAGMAIEDGAVLGECLSRISSKDELSKALAVYELCRKKRTERIVSRGNEQQYLYHLDDGVEQQERDRILQLDNPPTGEALVWRDVEMAPWLLGYKVKEDVDKYWSNSDAPVHEIAAL